MSANAESSPAPGKLGNETNGATKQPETSDSKGHTASRCSDLLGCNFSGHLTAESFGIYEFGHPQWKSSKYKKLTRVSSKS
jgi:hypothetical protein